MSTHLLDRWILARLKRFEQQVVQLTDDYRVDQAARLFISFINDLSNWYVRRSRQRFQKPASPEQAAEAFTTLYTVLLATSKLLASFMPFVSEHIYRNLTGKASVHLESLPTPEAQLDPAEVELLEHMDIVLTIVAAGLALRAKAKIKVRQPLSELVIETTEKLSAELITIIAEEVNVKTVSQQALPSGEHYIRTEEGAPVAVALQTEITPALKAEGIARDSIRQGQLLRRQAGYALNDQIEICFTTDSEGLKAALADQQQTIEVALQGTMVDELTQSDASAEVTIDGQLVRLEIRLKNKQNRGKLEI